jgi:serine protease inhibitor
MYRIKLPLVFVSILLLSFTPSDESIKKTAQNNNDFAFELYQKIAEKEKENIFISPFSISTALAMTYVGANSQTAKDMAKTLRFEENNIDFHSKYAMYLKQLENNAKNTISLNIANRLWADKKYELQKTFNRRLIRYNVAKNCFFRWQSLLFVVEGLLHCVRNDGGLRVLSFRLTSQKLL